MRVALPTIEEYAASYPHYGPRAAAEGRAFFDLVMRAEVFRDAATLTRLVRLPAVTAIADAALELAGGQLANTDRQYLGTLVCKLMESNGFAKTGRKASIPHASWNRGEVYVEASEAPWPKTFASTTS